MKELQEYLKRGGQLHHCHVLVGDTTNSFLALENFCQESLDFSFQGNNNFFILQTDNFLVQDAENFIERKSRKISDHSISLSVIICQNITREAQNSLLKIFEEPIPGNYFFLLVPTLNLLLPTVLSRASVISFEDSYSFSEEFQKIKKNYSEILITPYKDRLTFISQIFVLLKKEKIYKTEISKYIFFLLSEINKEFLKSKSKELKDILSRAQIVAKYADKPGVSLKNLLEYLMLLIPNSDIIKE